MICVPMLKSVIMAGRTLTVMQRDLRIVDVLEYRGFALSGSLIDYKCRPAGTDRIPETQTTFTLIKSLFVTRPANGV